jgi:hypothetical protein
MSVQGAAIAADFERFKTLFDFTRNDLGKEVAELIAAGIFEYMDAQVDPSNIPWVPLSDKYAEWKAKRFPGEKMSELYLRMKAPDQLKGEVEITTHRVAQTYGLDDEARQEAVWFQEGNDRQPGRRFYEFNDLVLNELAALFDRHFDSVIGP